MVGSRLGILIIAGGLFAAWQFYSYVKGQGEGGLVASYSLRDAVWPSSLAKYAGKRTTQLLTITIGAESGRRTPVHEIFVSPVGDIVGVENRTTRSPRANESLDWVIEEHQPIPFKSLRIKKLPESPPHPDSLVVYLWGTFGDIHLIDIEVEGPKGRISATAEESYPPIAISLVKNALVWLLIIGAAVVGGILIFLDKGKRD